MSEKTENPTVKSLQAEIETLKEAMILLLCLIGDKYEKAPSRQGQDILPDSTPEQIKKVATEKFVDVLMAHHVSSYKIREDIELAILKLKFPNN